MALITRCPVCGTRFKVVPDQLRISDGWVRCGECGEVFDASADLSQGEVAAHAPGPAPVPSTPPSTSPPPPQPPANAPAPWPLPPLPASEPRLEWDAEAGFSEPRGMGQPARYGEAADGADNLSIASLLHDRQDDVHPAPPPAALPVLRDADAPGRSPGPAWLRAAEATPGGNEPATVAPQDPLDPEPEPDAVDEQGSDDSATDGTLADEAEDIDDTEHAEAAEADNNEDHDDHDDDSEGTEEEVAQALAEFPADLSTLPESTVYLPPPPRADVDAALAAQQPSFLNTERAPEPAAAQRPWLRRGMVALAVLLALLLAGQVAVQQRDQLAAQMPATRPLLQALCVPLGCTVQPLRHIESIVIDNSTFTTLRHGVYRLNLVLKNRGATALAVPAIELALTDTQEQPVLRRVLQPVDMAGASGTISPIAPDGEWTASMELSVADEALIGRIVGYRLLAFYP